MTILISVRYFVDFIIIIFLILELFLQLIIFIQADQICYAVLCVFSYVAAGSEKRLRAKNLPMIGTTPSQHLSSSNMSNIKEDNITEENLQTETLTLKMANSPRQDLSPAPSPEPGSVTPVGGPPSYPPPALPPGVQPPAPPPGLKYSAHGGNLPSQPPPVPSRNLLGQPLPPPPPRPK